MPPEPFRRYVLVLSLIVAGVLTAVGAVNVAVDPLWVVPGLPHVPDLTCVRDERQNKTNRIAFGPEAYDTVLFGSSRSSYLDVSLFGGRGFNYSANSLYPDEIGPYLDFFAAAKGAPKRIVLGVDFYGSSANPERSYPPPGYYIGRATDPAYRVKTLLSGETAEYALHNLRKCGAGTLVRRSLYGRDGTKHRSPIPPDEARQEAERQYRVYRERYYGPAYAYDAGLKDTFAALKAAYPDAEFIVYTTPISAPLFDLLVAEGRHPDYRRWIGDLVAVFGTVYDFMGHNRFTEDLSNYRDAHHFYPDRGAILVGRMLGRPVPGYEDVGTVVTATALAGVEERRPATPAHSKAEIRGIP